MSLWNLGSATARVVGENTLGWLEPPEPRPNLNRPVANCDCSNVGRQAPTGFKPVVETETEDGGTFYEFIDYNYESIKGELEPSFWSVFKFWE